MRQPDFWIQTKKNWYNYLHGTRSNSSSCFFIRKFFFLAQRTRLKKKVQIFEKTSATSTKRKIMFKINLNLILLKNVQRSFKKRAWLSNYSNKNFKIIYRKHKYCLMLFSYFYVKTVIYNFEIIERIITHNTTLNATPTIHLNVSICMV